jgi:hypothetical protein
MRLFFKLCVGEVYIRTSCECLTKILFLASYTCPVICEIEWFAYEHTSN